VGKSGMASLSKDNIYALRQCKGDELTRLLAQLLAIDNYCVQGSNSVLLDFYLGNLSFAQQSRFDDAKTAAVFSLLKDVYEISLAHLSLEDSFQYFKKGVLCLCSVNSASNASYDVQSSDPLFTADDVHVITDYFVGTFYQHYKLFSFAYNNAQDNLEVDKHIYVQTCLTPSLSLSHALNEQEWLKVTKSLYETRGVAPIPNGLGLLEIAESKSLPISLNGQKTLDAHRILDTIYQTANGQIKQLMGTLQKQFDNKDEQITGLLARVESNL